MFRYKIIIDFGTYADNEFHVENYYYSGSTLIPVINIKKSYIIENSLNYNTNLSGINYKILFFDNDLARKIQPFNVGNFNSITITGSTTGLPQFNSVTYHIMIHFLQLILMEILHIIILYLQLLL